MCRIILALLLVFPLSGYGQTAKYILDGNDDVKIEFFNSTNVSVISNAVSSNSSAFRNSLELGAPWLTNTSEELFKADLGLSVTNNVNFNSVTVGDVYTINSNGDVSGVTGDGVTISSNGITFNTGGPIMPGSLPPTANTTRTNLGLGSPWLTNNTTEFFRRDIGLGATNAVRFSSILIDEGISYGPGNSVASSSGAPGVFISQNGISFRDGPLPPGALPATANTTRTNLGLGASWLTNTSEELFKADLGISVTNNVEFNSVTVGNAYTIDNNGNVSGISGDGVTISSNGITFNTGGPIMPGSLPPAANTTRTNLGLGASWLTNTNSKLFARDLELGVTNSVSFRQVDIDWSVSIDANGQFIYSPGAVLISIRQDGIYFSDGAPTLGLPTTALNTRKNLGFSTNLNTFWSATNTAELQTALFNSSSLNAQSQRITNLATPVDDNDAATKAYVFNLFNRVAPTVTLTNSVNTVEIGSTIMSVNLGWSISPTNTPVSSQSMSASQGTFNSINTTSRTTTAFIPGPIGFPNQPFTSDTTWTLTVNDGTGLPGGIRTNTTSIAFRHYMSWGIASTTSLDNSQIQNLHTNTPAGAGREFRTGKGKSVSISGNGQYIYFAYPASFGAASFIVNNAPNTAWISNTVTYTNSSGNASQFLIYRSTDVQFGTSIPITIN